MGEPPAAPFELVAEDQVLMVRGEIDMETASLLSRALDTLDSGVVVLDLEGVTFINSTGLKALVIAQQTARQRGADMILRRPSPVVHRVLELSSMTDTFVIED